MLLTQLNASDCHHHYHGLWSPDEQVMFLHISQTLTYTYDDAFWAEEFLHLKPVMQVLSYSQAVASDLSCCAFLTSAVFCLFIGCVACEGLLGDESPFFKLLSGVYVKTSNELQLFYSTRSVEFISIFIACFLFICNTLLGLYCIVL